MAKEITIHSEYQDRTESNKKDIFFRLHTNQAQVCENCKDTFSVKKSEANSY